MIHRKPFGLTCLLMLFVASAAAQQPLTPPIQPHLAPVVTPPPVVLSPPSGGTAVAGPITAQEAARIALLHQPQVAIARAAIQAAHGDVLIAEGALLPNGTVATGYSRQYALPIIGSPSGGGLINQGVSASITASQLLFDFGRTIDAVRQAEAQQRASTYAFTASEADVVFTAKQNFYTFVQNLRQVDVASANLADRQDNLALAQARLNAGLGPPGDVVTAQTNVAAATITLITARTAATTSEIALALSMGIDPRTPIVPADSQEAPLNIENVDRLIDQALKERPEIKEQQQLIRAAGYGVSIARKTLLPSINFVAGASGVSNTALSRQGSVGVTLSWDPFDIVTARGRNETARASLEIQRQNLISQSQTVVSDVSDAYVRIKAAEQRIGISNAEVINATEGLRIAEGQYRAGVTTFVTVTDAETNLANARTDAVTAVAALQLARASMERAVGRPL